MRFPKLTFFIYIFILLSYIVSAQGGGPPPPGLPDDKPDFPIDTHSSKLLAAGIVLGFIISMSRKKP